MSQETTEQISKRPTLYERLKPEVIERLSVMPNPNLRKHITQLLQEKQYFTEVTVGDMCAILQLLEYDVTLVNYIALFNNHQSPGHD